MSAFFEIAYAAASNRLCLFTGTGFSKAVTENAAPGWQRLLEDVCDVLPDKDKVKAALFPKGGQNPLSLEEAAQVIALELAKHGKDINEEIYTQINAIKLSGDNSVIADFLKNNSLRIFTTNYDKLAEELAGKDKCHSITPGFPIPRSPATTKVYHVHGSIDSPSNMVVTSENYFKFMNGESYFSRKLSTALHENTVVILGYSLADTNLKTIINDYKGFSRNHVISGNIFLVSRSKVSQHVKDYYAHCYGIRVLDNLEVHEFFEKTNASLKDATKIATSSVKYINEVLFSGKIYTDDYLKVETSFLEITTSVGAIGRSIDDPIVVSCLDSIIQRKIAFTGITNAWEQYEHLAKWLCHLASILELPKTSIKNTFVDAVLKSMNSMSKEYFYGYSWHAYGIWKNRWQDLLSPNRKLIKDHIEKHCSRVDALDLVKRG